MAKSELMEFVLNDIDKQKGIAIPVRASLFERLTVRNTACKNLHPNHEDEFSMESVGPSFKIISEYESKFRDALRMERKLMEDPLIVEKLRPHGYLLLNGHHRWAAAMRCNIKRVPIKIVNCASESDIKTILENSQHDKRATIDLDEVIFRPSDYQYLENKAFIFPFDLRFKQRIRLGIPALFYKLSKSGYDIWVYSRDFYSIDDLQKIFKAYSVHVDGILTGVDRHDQKRSNREAHVSELINNKYEMTLHIDNNTVLETHRENGKFEEYEINVPEKDWSGKAIAIIEEIEKRGSK